MATNALSLSTGCETDRDLPYNARIARAIGYVAELLSGGTQVDAAVLRRPA